MIVTPDCLTAFDAYAAAVDAIYTKVPDDASRIRSMLGMRSESQEFYWSVSFQIHDSFESGDDRRRISAPSVIDRKEAVRELQVEYEDLMERLASEDDS